MCTPTSNSQVPTHTPKAWLNTLVDTDEEKPAHHKLPRTKDKNGRDEGKLCEALPVVSLFCAVNAKTLLKESHQNFAHRTTQESE